MGDPKTINKLEQELLHKDSVIEALTSQLESTVDQLDRFQRGGASTGTRETGFGPRATAQIKQTLADFEEVSVLEHFERLEIGVEQILELLSGEARTLGDSRDSRDQESGGDDAVANLLQNSKSVANPSYSADDEGDFWARTKARLMSEGSDDSSSDSQGESAELTNADDSDASDSSTTDTEPSDLAIPEAGGDRSRNRGTEIPPAPPALPDAPKPVERLDDLTEVEEAISERDNYISYLITRLRKAELQPFEPIDWEKMSNVPADLEKSLINLQHHLVQHVSQAELSISLDRAALTRERAKLRQIKDKLMSEIQQIGTPASSATSYRERMEERLNNMLK